VRAFTISEGLWGIPASNKEAAAGRGGSGCVQEFSDHRYIVSMPSRARRNTTPERLSQQSEIPKDIQNLMADKLIRET
jgi:hypothetical protein